MVKKIVSLVLLLTLLLNTVGVTAATHLSFQVEQESLSRATVLHLTKHAGQTISLSDLCPKMRSEIQAHLYKVTGARYSDDAHLTIERPYYSINVASLTPYSRAEISASGGEIPFCQLSKEVQADLARLLPNESTLTNETMVSLSEAGDMVLMSLPPDVIKIVIKEILMILLGVYIGTKWGAEITYRIDEMYYDANGFLIDVVTSYATTQSACPVPDWTCIDHGLGIGIIQQSSDWVTFGCYNCGYQWTVHV